VPANDSVALELPLSEARLPTHSDRAPRCAPVHRHVAPRPRVVVPATRSRSTRAHVRRTRVPVPGGSPGAAGPAAGVTDRDRMALVGSKIAVGEQTVCNRTIAQWRWQRALFEQHGGTAVQRAAAVHGALQEGAAPGHCAFAQQWAKPGKQRSGDIFVPGGTSRAARASEALSECTLARVTTSAERRACSVAQSGAERASSLGPPNSRSSTVITRYRPSAPACRNGVLRVLRAYRGTQRKRVLRVLTVHDTASPPAAPACRNPRRAHARDA
jgi:hypothetical protein